MSGPAAELRGCHILILNWRDVRHPEAGGAEQYMHEIGVRWVQAGAHVTWFTARAPRQPDREKVGGIDVRRAGGRLSVYARTAMRLVRTRGNFDVVVDCQNGIPFFAPLFVGRDTPVVQVIHHVHQDQFATFFPGPMAALGRLLESRVARRVYGVRAIAAVSPSTRIEVRRRLGFTGPVFVVPNGTIPVPEPSGERSPVPTVALVSRLVPHKRIDLLLGHLADVAAEIPGLRVDIAGDGPERPRLEGLAADLGLQAAVRFHGRVPDHVRDDLLARAWVTTSTSAAEGWGCAVIEAAAWGLPCVALTAPGIRDSVLHGETGWLVEDPAGFGAALVDAIEEMRDPTRAEERAAACRRWASCFSWDRSAGLLAGVVLEEMRATRARRAGWGRNRRSARSDIAVLAAFQGSTVPELRGALRSTDEVVTDADRTAVVLCGCDEFDAANVLTRIGVSGFRLQLADRRLLLGGPAAPRARGSEPGRPDMGETA